MESSRSKVMQQAQVDVVTKSGSESTNKDVLYDPRDTATLENPYPAFRRLRDEAPVYKLPDDPVWVLSRFADVEAAMLDWQTFSSAKGNNTYEDPMRVGRTMTTNDPPRHDELRRLVASGFTAGRVKAHEERIALAVDRLIDKIDPDGFDFMTEFAAPLTGQVIASLIGVPDGNLEQMRIAVDIGLTPTDEHPNGPGLAEVFDFMLGLIAERRKEPTGDMLSVFLASEEKGVSFSDLDIAVTSGSLLAAGFSSTGHSMGNIMLSLYNNPDQLRLVLNDLSLVPAMVEEGLRYDPGVMSFARQTTRDVELHGVTIPADSRVMMMFSSANHDERKFEDPETFNILRKDANRHISFNVGVHHCMGSSLARLEMRLAYERLLARIGEFELDLDRAERPWSLNFRGFRTLPTRAQRGR